MTEIFKLAYVAGVVDGEGSLSLAGAISMSKNGTPYWTYQVGVGIYNTSRPLMEWLVTNFGGEFAARKRSPKHKQCYRWRLENNEKREAFLRVILPYLIVKPKQAELLLRYFSLKRISPKERHEIYREMKRLNARRIPN
jgi:hypothetical protein